MEEVYSMLGYGTPFTTRGGSQESTSGSGTSLNFTSSNEKAVETQRAGRASNKRDKSNASNRSDGPSKRGTVPGHYDLAERRLACPYFQRNPSRYMSRRSCPGPGWKSVHRVKEHLYRKHMQVLQCLRCWEVMWDDAGLYDHLRAAQTCVKRDNGEEEGGSREQKDSLKPVNERRRTSRKKKIGGRYYEYDEKMKTDGPIKELVQCEVFLQREVPRLVRRRLEGIVNANEVIRLVEIVRDCQAEAFCDFRLGNKPQPEHAEMVQDAIEDFSANPTTKGLAAVEGNDQPPPEDLLAQCFIDLAPVTKDNLLREENSERQETFVRERNDMRNENSRRAEDFTRNEDFWGLGQDVTDPWHLQQAHAQQKPGDMFPGISELSPAIFPGAELTGIEVDFMGAAFDGSVFDCGLVDTSFVDDIAQPIPK
ncbi:hypothetical protein NA57DRAFT_81278 [Rhizodiscina lignyota]|uniref:C2H2-type domain-containing protein n=1 Tax=Rhizodiscina lignyota TaxID=1504668 RepID=A0A9P4I4J5_9PEZI|nr:hypothetical protein NA57DRAFT_81278 [Rhizodiscina lignyota]